MGTCKGCGVEIRWLTIGGKPHPFEAETVQVIKDPSGNVRGAEDVGQGEGVWVRGRRLAPEEPHWNQTVTDLYVSHFATCPQAASFRRGGSG